MYRSALLVFYAMFAAVSLLRGGSPSVELLQGVALHMAFVALAVAVSLLGSLLFTPSANLTLSSLALVAMFFFGRRLPEYASAAPSPVSWLLGVVYAAAPHAEFFDMRQRLVHGWGAVDAAVFCAVLLYAAAYVALLLGFAAVALKKRKGL